MSIFEDIKNYQPVNDKEKEDKEFILNFLSNNKDAFLRSNLKAHMTSSSWITNKKKDKVIMIYHKIYNSWSWTGGHADGDEDLLNVAIKEAKEETGINHIKPIVKDIISLEVLTVDGHMRRGEYVAPHLHLNITYLLEADENDKLKIKEDENSGVKWFSLEESIKVPNEKLYREIIYPKLNNRILQFKK